MINLYNLNGKRYLAILCICQLSIFILGLLFILLFILNWNDWVEITDIIISIPLFFLYGILALWIGLFWKALSQITFSDSSANRTIFQRWFLMPITAFCLIGAYGTHTLLLLHQSNNYFIVAFIPLFLAGIVGVTVTSIFLIKLLRYIKDEEKFYIKSQNQLLKLKEKFEASSIKRIELSIDMADGKYSANPTPDQQGFQVVGLTSKPWYDMSNVPITKLLENSYEIIKQEALKIIENQTLLKPFDYLGVNDGAWDTIELLEVDKKVDEVTIFIPEIVKLLDNISKYIKLTNAALSVLKPGKIIKPHRDPDNFQITCHLGISIPKKCGISVAGESRTWEEGKCLFFDSSYEHTAWNDSDIPRVVLLLIFYKPELTDIEMDFLDMFLLRNSPDKMISLSEDRLVSHQR